MTATVVAIFAIVYLGMILGGLPFVQLDLLVVGSIANIIVLDAARHRGIAIDWRAHASTGVPVTFATLAITAAWFAWRLPAGPS